ncbi:MAG: TlpA family protein disulfide reductase [Nitrospirae bacterium]|nr:TlpA family protein disulfide reductase [Nitrospirota bacterium]
MNKAFLLLLIFVLGLAMTACNRTDSTSVVVLSAEINGAAPDFTRKDLSGKSITLSDYKGKVVLLEFWATWCPPCKASIPGLIALHKKFEQKGFIILGVSIDTDSDALEQVRRFAASHSISYPVLLADESMPKQYNVVSIPTSFLIGKDGKIVDINKGYSEDFDKRLSAQIEALL